MVGRILVGVWSLLDRLHDSLHERLDRRKLEYWTVHTDEHGYVEGTADAYSTSPAQHYLGDSFTTSSPPYEDS